MIVIDAKHAVLGRLASFAAKQARLGNEVVIINSEKAVIIGQPKKILEDYLTKLRLGRGSKKGPKFPRKPTAILKRTIRGMIARKTAFGRQAFKRIKCYESIPKEYAQKEKISFEAKNKKAITLGELSKLIKSS